MRIGGLTAIGNISGDITGNAATATLATTATTATTANEALDLNIAGQTQGDVLFFNGTDWIRLAAAAAGRVLTTQGGGANPSFDAIPLPTDLNISGQQNGSILYFNGVNWIHLSPGISGQLLQSNGAAAPSWENVSSVAGSEAFAAYNSGSQQASNFGTTTMGFDTELFDDGGNHSGGTFTAPATGRYFFAVSGKNSGSGRGGFNIRVNGSTFTVIGGGAQGSPGGEGMAGSVVLSLSSGNTVQVQLQSSQDNSNVTIAGGLLNNHFSGFRVA